MYFAITMLMYLGALLMNRKQWRYYLKLAWIIPVFFYLYWLQNVVATFAAFYHLFDTRRYANWGDSDRGEVS